MKKLLPLISDFPLQTLNEAIALRVFVYYGLLFYDFVHRPYE